MKIRIKAVALNLFTLGFSGYRRAKKLAEQHLLYDSVVFSREIIGLMLAIPVFSAVLIIFGIIENLEVMSSFFESLYAGTEVEGVRTSISETLSIVPFAFLIFCSLHLFLGVAFLQHAHGLKRRDVLRVLWFGFYALDWNPSDWIQLQAGGSQGKE